MLQEKYPDGQEGSGVCGLPGASLCEGKWTGTRWVCRELARSSDSSRTRGGGRRMDSPARGAEALAQDPAGHRRQETETFAPELSCLVPSIDLSISQPDVQGPLPPAPCMGGATEPWAGPWEGGRRQQSRDLGVLGPAVAPACLGPPRWRSCCPCHRPTLCPAAPRPPAPACLRSERSRHPGTRSRASTPSVPSLPTLSLPLHHPTAGDLYLPACPEESAQGRQEQPLRAPCFAGTPLHGSSVQPHQQWPQVSLSPNTHLLPNALLLEGQQEGVPGGCVLERTRAPRHSAGGHRTPLEETKATVGGQTAAESPRALERTASPGRAEAGGPAGGEG